MPTRRRRDARELDAETEREIDRLWDPASPIGIVEYHRVIGYQARDLLREAMASGLALKSHDAIHLGTAMNQRCDQVFTYDEKLWKFSTAVGIPIGPPSNPQPQLSEQRSEHG